MKEKHIISGRLRLPAWNDPDGDARHGRRLVVDWNSFQFVTPPPAASQVEAPPADNRTGEG
jgi:hypothetical protein